MRIAVLTPDREIFQGTIKSVKVPGTRGEFQVLTNHAPIVSALEHGKVEIITAGGEFSFYDLDSEKQEKDSGADKKINFRIEGGFIEVLKNEISLLVQGVQK